jgi:hypothetical protein
MEIIVDEPLELDGMPLAYREEQIGELRVETVQEDLSTSVIVGTSGEIHSGLKVRETSLDGS